MNSNLYGNKSYIKIICINIFIFFILRFYFSFFIGDFEHSILDSDSYGYIKFSKILFNFFSFVENKDWYDPGILRTPGYPIILKLFESLITSNLIIFAKLQMFFFILIIFIFFSIFKEENVNDINIIFIFSLLLIFNFQLIFYSHMILTDFFHLILLSVIFYLALKIINNKHKYLLSFSIGILLTLLIFVRPISIYLPFVIFFFILFFSFKKIQKSKILIFSFIIILIIPYFFVTLWQIRNHQLYEKYIFSYEKVRSLEFLSINLYGNKIDANVIEHKDKIKFIDQSLSSVKKKYTNDEALNRNLNIILNDPFRYISTSSKSFLNLFFSNSGGKALRYCGYKECEFNKSLMDFKFILKDLLYNQSNKKIKENFQTLNIYYAYLEGCVVYIVSIFFIISIFYFKYFIKDKIYILSFLFITYYSIFPILIPTDNNERFRMQFYIFMLFCCLKFSLFIKNILLIRLKKNSI